MAATREVYSRAAGNLQPTAVIVHPQRATL